MHVQANACPGLQAANSAACSVQTLPQCRQVVLAAADCCSIGFGSDTSSLVRKSGLQVRLHGCDVAHVCFACPQLRDVCVVRLQDALHS